MDSGSSTFLAFLPYATLKRPQKKNTTVLILHGFFSNLTYDC